MPKLNQIIAIVAGKKADAQKALTDLYHRLQKPALFEGLLKTYVPVDEGGEVQPPETKVLQLKVRDSIASYREIMGPVYNAVLTQDVANTKAAADVEVDGKVVLARVPVTHLLFLEKQLTDLNTFLTKLPTLDPAQSWEYSRDHDCYVTQRSWKYHTKKLPRVIEKSPATDKHPAQVELVHEDRNVGKWETISQSGAIPARDQHDMLGRVKKLIEAVKAAREKANMDEVENRVEAKAVFDFVFGA